MFNVPTQIKSFILSHYNYYFFRSHFLFRDAQNLALLRVDFKRNNFKFCDLHSPPSNLEMVAKEMVMER